MATTLRRRFSPTFSARKPWPGKRHMNVEFMFEYGSRAGFWRLWRLFTERKLPVTVFGVANALARNPQIVAAMREAGWDIACHGLKWIDYKDFSYADEARPYARSDPHPYRGDRRAAAGMVHRPQLRTHIEARARRRRLSLFFGFLCDDLPYWVKAPNKGPHLIIPYSLDANDMRFINAQGFPDGEAFFSYLRDTFDYLYAEGAQAPKMMSIGLHCRLAGRPGRAAGLARFLDHVGKFDRVWVASRLDIARHWHREHLALADAAPIIA